MKRWLRPVIERAFRQLPVSRAAYAQVDILQAKLDAFETSQAATTTRRCQQAESLSAVEQVGQHDPRSLETLIPTARTIEERVIITARCRDADNLPKVQNAGAVVQQSDGTQVQIMYNGIKVLAGGYYGAWMQDLISRCKGHHEPQEEVLFAEILKHISANATMFELGGYWSFYSIWFLSQQRQRRSFIVEPDPKHMEVGRINARLNDCEPVFISAFVGQHPEPPSAFHTESCGVVDLPCVSVADMMTTYAIDHLDLLHCDAQGAELSVLESCVELATAGRLSWVVVSTHTHHISNDPLTHQRCLAILRQAGAAILAEHDVQESFSGDGLIVAKFGSVPIDWRTPKLSYNRYSEGLFRNPLYDLAEATKAVAPAPSTPLALLDNSQCLALRGGLIALTADCALGPAGDAILLPFDQVMFPSTVTVGGWALDTIEFVARRIDSSLTYAVMDIGANVGLFTRQAAIRFPNLTRFFCIEAEQRNFRALQYNVSDLLGARGKLWNVALSDADGEARFFRDDENFGNYSLNGDAMRGRSFDVVTVQSVATDRWMRDHISLEADDRLIWKSDTQGHDELIISLTPFEIWDRVDLAVVELWRIEKPSFDQAEFCRRIEAFPNKSIGVGNLHTMADILEFLDGNDWHHADLYLWR